MFPLFILEVDIIDISNHSHLYTQKSTIILYLIPTQPILTYRLYPPPITNHHVSMIAIVSIGVVAYTLLCGYEPFFGNDDQVTDPPIPHQ